VLVLYFILAAIGGYLLGSIPFGLVLTRVAGLGDIRTSAPAISARPTCCARAARISRWPRSCSTPAKQALHCCSRASPDLGDISGEQQMQIGLLAGCAAFIGHCYPVWLGFKGGKGVATFFGVLFAGIWPLGLVSGVTWLAVATIFRYSSLAALSAPQRSRRSWR
jgi:glycerol-3-phosphate acyltransferase PlsY